MTTGADNTDLIALAERVEALTGPCRETDKAIMDALVKHGVMAFRVGLDNFRVTASLDAAMSLVPEGSMWACGNHDNYRETPWAWCLAPGMSWDDADNFFAATPALALTAAALRARTKEHG